jgi:hypothetical protein
MVREYRPFSGVISNGETDRRVLGMTADACGPTFLLVNAPSDIALPPEYAGSWTGLALRLAGRALLSPRLALDLTRTAWAFRRRNWWRQSPFVPVPDPTYLRWRMYTAYGDERAVPPADDVIRFARWRRTTMGL